ncbi:MAG TPA: porin [Thermoanaerobaculia bacterium]|nr:porin [Thermoanaerobaculia bacterium]
MTETGRPGSQRRYRLGARAIIAAAALAAARPAVSQEPAAAPGATVTPAPAPAPKSWYEEITVNGFVSGKFSYNTNRPASGTNQFRVFDFDDETVKVDAAEFVLQKAVARRSEAGFRIDAVAGGSIPRVSAAAGLFRDASGKAHDFDLQQAFVSYIAAIGSGLRFDAGKFVTHHGYEVIEGYDGYNDNATRSFLFGYAIPFTHTGFKAGYRFSDQLAAVMMLATGWDVVKDNNSGKSLGAQITFTPSTTVTVVANYTLGPERTHNGDPRNVVNVNAQWKVVDRSILAVDIVYGTEANAVAQGQTATWDGIVAYARFGLDDNIALVLRGELFNDPDGARTGVAQMLKGITLTPELRVTSHFLIRADLRIDWSNHDVFEKKEGFTGSQPTGLLNVMYLF